MYPGESLARAADASLGIGQPRLLALAVLASLALHLLVLYVLPILKESIRAPARPLTAQLAKPVPPEPARVESPAQRSLASPPAPRPAPVTKPARPTTASEIAAPARSVEPIQPAQATEPMQAVPAAAAAPSPTPALPAASAPDLGSVARYRLALMEIAPRYKRYPRIALDNNWEGRVELRIAVGESGSIASLTVKKGTGRAALDDAAQSMIRSAQAQVVMPPALRGKAFAIDVAVDFVLKEERWHTPA